MTTFQVVNPYTGEAGDPVPLTTEEEVESAITSALTLHASRAGSATLTQRAQAVRAIADLHRERREELALTIVREMGKPLTQARGEVEFCEAIYRFYADHAEEFLANEIIPGASGRAEIRKDPIGPVLGIMPWNYPLYQIARFAAPNLILGNPVLVKPAPQCPDSSRTLDAIVQSTELPRGSFSTLFLDDNQTVGLIQDERIRGVSLTGSERAGRVIGAAAGASLKKVVLELGGSDPFILLSTDNLTAAVNAAVFARIDNNGQVCNGAKRFIVIDELYDEFAEEFCAVLTAIVPGDPMAERTELGPLSSITAARNLEGQIAAAVAGGASLLAGTGRREGTLFAPAILERLTPDNPAFNEEFFGPIAQLHRANDENHAIALANQTPYGLGSYVFSTDLEQAERVAAQLDVGMVFINEVAADAPELPFGGVKNSGTGRELGALGIEEFMNRKLVKQP